MTPPPHTALHGWNPIERQRNGDLVVPLVIGGGDVLPLRGTQEACVEFAHAILAATRAERAIKRTAAKAQSRQPVTKPSGRML